MRKGISTLLYLSAGYLFIRAILLFSLQNVLVFLGFLAIAIVHHHFSPK